MSKKREHYAEVYDYMADYGALNKKYTKLIVIKVDGVNYGAAKLPIADAIQRA